MKRIVFILLTGILLESHAQTSLEEIRLSYFSPFGNNFGAKLGTTLPIKDWEDLKKKGITSSLFLAPQLGFFVRPSVNRNYLINAEIGIKRSAIERKSYLAYSFGIGYLLSSEVLGGAVNLGTGDFTENTELRSFLLPTLNVELGSHKRKRFTLFYRLSYGRKISFNDEDAGFFAFEIGTRFLIKPPSK